MFRPKLAFRPCACPAWPIIRAQVPGGPWFTLRVLDPSVLTSDEMVAASVGDAAAVDSGQLAALAAVCPICGRVYLSASAADLPL